MSICKLLAPPVIRLPTIYTHDFSEGKNLLVRTSVYNKFGCEKM